MYMYISPPRATTGLHSQWERGKWGRDRGRGGRGEKGREGGIGRAVALGWGEGDWEGSYVIARSSKSCMQHSSKSYANVVQKLFKNRTSLLHVECIRYPSNQLEITITWCMCFVLTPVWHYDRMMVLESRRSQKTKTKGGTRVVGYEMGVYN